MPLLASNWTLNSYTNSTWTDVVAEPATLTTVIVANTSGSPVNVSLRLEDSGTPLATMLPTLALAANSYHTVSIRSLNITGTQALQLFADAAGAEVIASGVK